MLVLVSCRCSVYKRHVGLRVYTSVCAVFFWSICHVIKGQKNGPFPLCRLPVPDRTGRQAIFKVLFACSICQTQTGQMGWWQITHSLTLPSGDLRGHPVCHGMRPVRSGGGAWKLSSASPVGECPNNMQLWPSASHTRSRILASSFDRLTWWQQSQVHGKWRSRKVNGGRTEYLLCYDSHKSWSQMTRRTNLLRCTFLHFSHCHLLWPFTPPKIQPEENEIFSKNIQVTWNLKIIK